MKEYKKALVIIDMQYNFEASRDKYTIAAVIDAAKQAMESDLPIFVLEFAGHGTTLPVILAEIGGYDKAFFAPKKQDDGSKELMQLMKDNEISVEEFVLCGVNTCCCVARTACGLAIDYDAQLTILENACNCITYFHNHKHIPDDILNDVDIDACAVFNHPNVKVKVSAA